MLPLLRSSCAFNPPNSRGLTNQETETTPSQPNVQRSGERSAVIGVLHAGEFLPIEMRIQLQRKPITATGLETNGVAPSDEDALTTPL